MSTTRLESKRAVSWLQSAAAVALMVASAGCAGARADGPSPRLPVRQERATIVIEGQGTVSGGEIACTSASSAVCSAQFEELWATMLEARPAPGWRFAGWQRQAAPGLPEVVYTAMFEPDASQLASSAGRASR